MFPFGNPSLELRRLRRRDREALFCAMSASPAMAGFGLGALQAGIVDAPHAGAAVFGLMRGNEVVAAVFCFDGVAAWLFGADEAAGGWCGREMAGLAPAIRLVAGPAAMVSGFWESFHAPGHEVRTHLAQTMFELTSAPEAAEPFALPLARESDLEDLLTASCEMHEEELGLALTSYDTEAYRHGLVGQVIEQRVWCLRHAVTGQLMFKASIASPSPLCAQVEGVWVPPQFRRSGVAQRAVRELCVRLLRRHDRVSLYVNNDNGAALGLYRKLGFREVGAFATLHAWPIWPA